MEQETLQAIVQGRLRGRLGYREKVALLERMEREAAEQDEADGDLYARFGRLYRDDPAGFVRDCVRWKPGRGATHYQSRALSAIVTEHRVAVRGPHGLGKTAMQAWLILWFALTRDALGLDWKVPTTSSTWRQLTKYLWPEVHKWARMLDWEKIGRRPFRPGHELQVQALKLKTGEAFAIASSDHEKLEGAHADQLFVVFDESKIIPDPTWDAIEGAFSGGGVDDSVEAFAFACSTPGSPVGRFYDIHRRAPGFDDWHAIHVTLLDSVAAGRISEDWAEQRRRQWGEGSALYHNRVLGEFYSNDEDGVIPLAWVEAANERWLEWHEAGGQLPEFTCVGADIADSGSASTVLAMRFGPIITELRRFPKIDTMEAVAKIKGILDRYGGRAVVDAIGVGAGVVSRLRELKCKVIAFVASGGSDAKDESGEMGFRNKRSESWWKLREQLDPTGGSTIALPPDDRLTGDLTAATWREVSGAKIEVESKVDIAKRIGRSTDDGDAVMQAFTVPAHKGVGGYRSVNKRRHAQRVSVWR